MAWDQSQERLRSRSRSRRGRIYNRRGQKQLVATVLYCFLVLTVLTSKTVFARDVFVSLGQFYITLSPLDEDIELDDKETLLWTVESLIRDFLYKHYEGSTDSVFITAGVTGLAVVPATTDSDVETEIIRFLGGMATFDSATSSVIPTEQQLTALVQLALDENYLLPALDEYFPSLQKASFSLPTTDTEEQQDDQDDEDDSDRGYGQDVIPNEVQTVDKTPEKNQAFLNAPVLTEFQPLGSTTSSTTQGQPLIQNALEGQPQQPQQNFNASNNTIAVPAGAAVASTFALLGILLLVHIRKKRMSPWRGDNDSADVSRDSGKSEHDLELEIEPVKDVVLQPVHVTGAWDDTGMSVISTSPVRFSSRMWGVMPTSSLGDSPRSTRTPPGSDDDDSMYIDKDDGNTTVTDSGLALQCVESFEHQKRLVDVLKKEMITSNAELHPYSRETLVDSTEPCALSPTDLSARALDQRFEQYGSWLGETGSDSGESGYETPSKFHSRISRQTPESSQAQGRSNRWNLQRLS